MEIPDDGHFRMPPTSNLNAFNDIMVVRVNNLKKIGETTFQLANADHSKKETAWPSDDYISKLIPGFQENIPVELSKAYKSRKELNLSVTTKAPRPKLFREPDPSRYNFIQTKPNFSDRSGNFENRLQSKETFLQNPWDNQIPKLHNGRNMGILPLPNNSFLNFSPPPLDNYNISGLRPPNFKSYYRQNTKQPNVQQHRYRNASNRVSRHDSAIIEPFSSYIEAERDNSGKKIMFQPGYSAINKNNGNVSRTLHENLPDSRYDPHSSFEDKYIDREMDNSRTFNDDMQRNNSNQKQYFSQSSQKQWNNNIKSKKCRNIVDSSNPSDMNLDSREGGNSLTMGNRNPVQKYNFYNRNQRKPWTRYRKQNFKPSGYRSFYQNAGNHFRGSSAKTDKIWSS